MEQSLQLRVVAIFEIFVISAVGAYLPQYIIEQTTLKKDSEDTVAVAADVNNESQQISETLLFRSLKCFSGGLVVAVAFCHLLADSVGDLSDDSLVEGTPGFPLTMSLAMTGVIFLVCLEQMTVVALDMIDNYEIHPTIGSTTNCIEQLPPTIIDQSDKGKPKDDRENDACDNPSHLHLQITTEIDINQQQPVTVTTVSVAEEREKKTFKKQFLKLILFEFSVALHSVIIGFNLGILTTADIPDIKILMVALGFHQFFEGFSLGTMIIDIQKLSWNSIILFIIAFALTTPIGILIGILTSSTTASDHANGVINALAGGFLIYAGLVEILHEEFARETSKKVSIQQRPVMCASMILGAVFMAILAIWA